MSKKNKMMGRIPLSRKSKGIRMPKAILNRFIHCIARYFPMFPSQRVFLHRLRGVKIGKEVFIGSDVFIDDADTIPLISMNTSGIKRLCEVSLLKKALI